MIVCKFGGSCMASASALKNIKTIKKNSNRRKVFVFSAIGKETESDIKITDLLIDLSNKHPKTPSYQNTKNAILKKFDLLLSLTKVKFDIRKAFNNAERNFLKNHSTPYLISRGEYFTTLIMARYLKLKFVPAERIVSFKVDSLDERKTQKQLKNYLSKYGKIATCGFYGADEKKNIQLFTRGGGDFSGAILSKALDARVYENWTDVEGVFDINPKIMKGSLIKSMSYNQLALMSEMDATVIHKDCPKLLSGTKTKLKIRSCFILSKKMTTVSNSQNPNLKFVCCKTTKDNATIVVCDKSKTKSITTTPQMAREVAIEQYRCL